MLIIIAYIKAYRLLQHDFYVYECMCVNAATFAHKIYYYVARMFGILSSSA